MDTSWSTGWCALKAIIIIIEMLVIFINPGVLLKPATKTTRGGNPYVAVLISWFLVQVKLPPLIPLHYEKW